MCAGRWWRFRNCLTACGLLLFFQVERPGELPEVVGHERLASNVSTILARLEGELDDVDSKIGESMHVLDLDNDGLVGFSFLSLPSSFVYHRRTKP